MLAEGTGASQAAKKLNPVKGTGFSPYINRAESTWASVPEGYFFAVGSNPGLFLNLFRPAELAQILRAFRPRIATVA
jgi:hypothetical protein